MSISFGVPAACSANANPDLKEWKRHRLARVGIRLTGNVAEQRVPFSCRPVNGGAELEVTQCSCRVVWRVVKGEGDRVWAVELSPLIWLGAGRRKACAVAACAG
eukprot:7019513-Prymnesium_polylepis.2